jgi:glycosyltransferase involved in cell wall biosynthesis
LINVKIVETLEFFEFYRGEKEFMPGKILAQEYDVEYISVVPNILSPIDRLMLGEKGPKIPETHIPNIKNYHITRVPAFLLMTHFPSLQITPFLILHIVREKPDIIVDYPYTTLTPRTYMSFISSRLLDVPFFVIDIGDIAKKTRFRRWLNKIEGLLIRRCARIIVYNEAAKKRYIEEYGVSQDKINIIPKGISVDKYNLSIPENVFKERYFIQEPFVAMYCGRLEPNKGPDALIEVAGRFQSMGVGDVAFVFVGKGSLEPYLEEGKKRNGLNNVYMVGGIKSEDMKYAYAAADVLVYPMNIPPNFSTVLAESMAMGKAIILGLKGHEDAMPIEDGKTGILVSPRSIEEISKNILLLRNEPELGKKLGTNARTFAEQKMDWGVQAREYLTIFQQRKRSIYKTKK